MIPISNLNSLTPFYIMIHYYFHSIRASLKTRQRPTCWSSLEAVWKSDQLHLSHLLCQKTSRRCDKRTTKIRTCKYLFRKPAHLVLFSRSWLIESLCRTVHLMSSCLETVILLSTRSALCLGRWVKKVKYVVKILNHIETSEGVGKTCSRAQTTTEDWSTWRLCHCQNWGDPRTFF